MRPVPVAGRLVLLVIGPEKRYQDIDIEQVNAHGKSFSASFTLRDVILGDPFGGSKTTRPLASRTGGTTCKPRRANSDTALPSDTFSISARLAASAKISSSRVNVVLMTK